MFSWKWLASNIEDLSFALSPPLCLNFQELPGIIVFLHVMFAVTRGVIVKHMHMYFIKKICITLSRDKSLTLNHAIRFGSILMPLFPHDSGDILKYKVD